MATLAVTNDFSAGTTIVAADMNENFSDIETFVNTTPGVLQLTGGTVTGASAFGVDGTGVDVTFHSDTAGDNMLWDASDEKLVITGTNGANALEVADGDVAITDNLTVTSNLTVTGTTTNHLTIENNSDAAIAPALGDENTYFVTTHATAVVTLPQNSAEAFEIGTVMYFERNGTGTLTFAAGTGASVTSKDSTLTCVDRYTTVATVKVSANGWSLIGNIG